MPKLFLKKRKYSIIACFLELFLMCLQKIRKTIFYHKGIYALQGTKLAKNCSLQWLTFVFFVTLW